MNKRMKYAFYRNCLSVFIGIASCGALFSLPQRWLQMQLLKLSGIVIMISMVLRILVHP